MALSSAACLCCHALWILVYSLSMVRWGLRGQLCMVPMKQHWNAVADLADEMAPAQAAQLANGTAASLAGVSEGNCAAPSTQCLPGRRPTQRPFPLQVAGACLYIFTRQTDKPVMLIDISDALAINVFDLGGVFLQLIRALCLDTHDNVIR